MARGSGRRRSLWIMAASVALVLTACPAPPDGGGGSGMAQFNAHVTDPAIRNEPLHPSIAYVPTAAPRGELAVLFNGTGAGPLAMTRLGARLSAAGFHVIGLRYESAVSTQWACTAEGLATDPDCHRAFRAEVVYGSGVEDPDGEGYDHPSVDVSAANSVMNRLVKHVEYLRNQTPGNGWDQFQRRSGGACTAVSPYGGCELRWDRVVTVGHSQGAGVALYMAKHHPLAGVAMLSGAYDASPVASGGYVAAPWVAEGGFEVPVQRIRTFSHVADPAIAIHRAVADGLGITGSEVLVTSSAPPYGGSGRLLTNATPACPFDTAPAHNSTATDLCAPGGAHDAAWRYLATGQ